MSTNVSGEFRKQHARGAPSHATELPPRIERRPKQRKRVLLSGIVAYSAGARSFPCSIRNLTESGARITLPVNLAVPSNVYLINLRERIAHEAKIVWTNGAEAGLSFVGSVALADVTDPKLAYLEKLWHGSATR
jgi:hypothetical protein